MKTRILFLAVIALFSGCCSKKQDKNSITEVSSITEIKTPYPSTGKAFVVEVDSCEYVVFAQYNSGMGAGITHKGNCKYCAERNKN